MDAPLPGNLLLQLRRLQAAVGGLEQHLKPALEMTQQELDQASPQQQAEFHLAVARGLAVVYTLYAKTTGVSAKSFQKDLDRLQLYQKKVSKMAYEAELATAKPTLQLDVATANRFINAAMSDLPAAQREAVRQQAPRKRQRKGDTPAAQPREPTAAELADAVIEDALGSD